MNEEQRADKIAVLRYKVCQMKCSFVSILVFLTVVQLVRADDFKTVNGKEYKNAKISRVEPDGIVLITKSGVSKVYLRRSAAKLMFGAPDRQ